MDATPEGKWIEDFLDAADIFEPIWIESSPGYSGARRGHPDRIRIQKI